MRSLSLGPDALLARPHGSHARLTAEQDAAAGRRRESMLLTAAAGSGKTSVLVERYVRAVLEDGIEPARILAITFTERAAWELKERIRGALGQLGRRELARDTEAASIGTIHGFCARLLRADPLAAGLAPNFTILEETAAARMRALACTEAMSAVISNATPAELDAAAAYNPDRLRQIVMAGYAELRSHGEAEPALPAPPPGGTQSALAALSLLDALLRAFGRSYEEHKRQRAAVDFDDLELLALSLLEEHPHLRTRWAERFDMLMVDEFQDTNRRQLRLLTSIERENLFTVGDEWQSIYGFRHAEVEIFRQRERELAGRDASLALTQNFRSRPGILEAVNAAFGKRFGDRFNLLEPAREAAREAGPAVEVLLTDARGWEREEQTAAAGGLPQAPAWRQAEARLIARRLKTLIEDGRAHPGEMAVLLRAMSDLAVYEAALRGVGLATASASAELWEAQEVQDALCWLRALANPLDELALHGVLAGPGVRLSAGALLALAQTSRREGERAGLWETICAEVRQQGDRVDLDASERLLLAGFHDRFVEQRRQSGERSLGRLVDLAFGARHPVRPSTAAGLRSARRLRQIAADFEALEGRDLRGFIDHLEQLARARALVGAQDAPADGQAVRLMSIHAAKGLEFPVVCVADLGRSGNGRDAPYLLCEGDRVGVRLASLDGSAPEPAFDYGKLMQARSIAEEQEEDRILYVAMTRAREVLLLSGAASFERWPNDGPASAPIAWLAPALIEDLPQRLAHASEQPTAIAKAEPGHQGALACLLSTPAGAAIDLPNSTPARPSKAPAGDEEPPTGARARQAPTARVLPVLPAEPTSAVANASLSYTALSELERCGYRYYLERMLRMPEVSLGSAAAAGGRIGRGGRGIDRPRIVGDVTHRLLESYDFAACQDPDIEQVQRAARELDLPIDSSTEQMIVETLSGIGTTPLARQLAQARTLHTEQPFCFALSEGGGMVTGVFDVIAFHGDGSCLVVDYKTGAVFDGDDLEALVARDYELQRSIYALAALRDGASSVEIAHWYLQRPDQPVIACFDASCLKDLEARLSARVQNAWRRGFVVSQTPHRQLCGTCPGRGTLCSWPQSATLAQAADPGSQTR